VDRRAAALQRVLATGAADRVIAPSLGTSLGKLVRELKGGLDADIVFEAVGGTDGEPL